MPKTQQQLIDEQDKDFLPIFEKIYKNNAPMMDIAKSMIDRDLARTNLFHFVISTLPKSMNNEMISVLNNIGMMVKTISTGGKALTTMENNTDGMMRKTAYDTLYGGEITVEFYLNPSLDLMKFFSKWMESIYNENGVVAFYDDYVVPATLYKLNRDLTPSATWQFHELYPVSIEQQTLTSGAGEISTVNVSFQHRSHEMI